MNGKDGPILNNILLLLIFPHPLRIMYAIIKIATKYILGLGFEPISRKMNFLQFKKNFVFFSNFNIFGAETKFDIKKACICIKFFIKNVN